MTESLDIVDEFYASAINRDALRDFYALIGGEEGVAELEERHRKAIRQGMTKAADAHPETVRFTQGGYDVLTKSLPRLLSVVMAQLQLHTRAGIDARKRIVELEQRIAAIEAKLANQETTDTTGTPTETDDPVFTFVKGGPARR